ncbi:MAG TPA: AAA family ATPase, partial [Eubacterium sp.]|nr:AAA family ATPase [Eubacterium sp.]
GLGLSPRGALNLMNLSRANAFMRGRNYVIPNDVKEVFPYVAGHRLILKDKTKNEHEMLMTVMNEILSAVKVPNIG